MQVVQHKEFGDNCVSPAVSQDLYGVVCAGKFQKQGKAHISQVVLKSACDCGQTSSR